MNGRSSRGKRRNTNNLNIFQVGQTLQREGRGGASHTCCWRRDSVAEGREHQITVAATGKEDKAGQNYGIRLIDTDLEIPSLCSCNVNVSCH
jgi:hypothetical protein